MSRARRGNNEPVSLSESLAGVGRELGLPEPSELTAVLEAWPELVGTEIARHAQVRSLRDGVLVVAVDDPAFATQVQYLETTVRDAAARLVGRPAVRSLRVVVQAPGRAFRDPLV
jgi:predicted nucleic acid-binding Zn ribbon protein